MSFYDDAKEAAQDAVSYFRDSIVERIADFGEASPYLSNDYPRGDEYHHSSHVDRGYSLLDAAQLLDELRDWEETDNGLWEGMTPREAIGAQAAYTFGNAVYDKFRELIEEINESLTEHDERREIIETHVDEFIQGARR